MAKEHEDQSAGKCKVQRCPSAGCYSEAAWKIVTGLFISMVARSHQDCQSHHKVISKLCKCFWLFGLNETTQLDNQAMSCCPRERRFANQVSHVLGEEVTIQRWCLCVCLCCWLLACRLKNDSLQQFHVDQKLQPVSVSLHKFSYLFLFLQFSSNLVLLLALSERAGKWGKWLFAKALSPGMRCILHGLLVSFSKWQHHRLDCHVHNHNDPLNDNGSSCLGHKCWSLSKGVCVFFESGKGHLPSQVQMPMDRVSHQQCPHNGESQTLHKWDTARLSSPFHQTKKDSGLSMNKQFWGLECKKHQTFLANSNTFLWLGPFVSLPSIPMSFENAINWCTAGVCGLSFFPSSFLKTEWSLIWSNATTEHLWDMQHFCRNSSSFNQDDTAASISIESPTSSPSVSFIARFCVKQSLPFWQMREQKDHAAASWFASWMTATSAESFTSSTLSSSSEVVHQNLGSNLWQSIEHSSPMHHLFRLVQCIVPKPTDRFRFSHIKIQQKALTNCTGKFQSMWGGSSQISSMSSLSSSISRSTSSRGNIDCCWNTDKVEMTDCILKSDAFVLSVVFVWIGECSLADQSAFGPVWCYFFVDK